LCYQYNAFTGLKNIQNEFFQKTQSATIDWLRCAEFFSPSSFFLTFSILPHYFSLEFLNTENNNDDAKVCERHVDVLYRLQQQW
jgi:hypothetical protein